VKREYEPTQPKNPHQLTVNQHIHSRACIKRFADSSGRVAVVLAGATAAIFANPKDAVFCALRVWDEGLEHGLFERVEGAFQKEVRALLRDGSVTDHKAISEYYSIWQIRVQLNDNPVGDAIVGVAEREISKDEEEMLEKKRVSFIRDRSVPGRFVARPIAVRQHNKNMLSLGGVRWGVLKSPNGPGFVCPGTPDGQPYIPLVQAPL